MASEELILSSLKKLKDAGLKGAPAEIGVDRLEIWAEVFDTVSDEMFAQLVVEYLRSEEFFPAPGSLYKMAEKRLETNIELAWRRVVQLTKVGISRVVTVERTPEEVEAGGGVRAYLDRCEDPERKHYIVSGFSLEHINDPYALWAMSQMENLDTLAHRDQPFKFAENKRAEFGRLYRAAFQRGYRLEQWNGRPNPILEKHVEQLAIGTGNRVSALKAVAELIED